MYLPGKTEKKKKKSKGMSSANFKIEMIFSREKQGLRWVGGVHPAVFHILNCFGEFSYSYLKLKL